MQHSRFHSRSLSKTEFISSFLFTPEVELGVFDVFSRVSSKSVLLFPTDVFRKKGNRKGWQAIIAKMTEVLIVTFGQNMVFLYRYG
jgi:hypothetical protein